MTELIFVPGGRLGNAIFRYMAMIALEHVIGPMVTLSFQEGHHWRSGYSIMESDFIEIMNGDKMPRPTKIYFPSFYQLENIYAPHIDYIKKYMLLNQDVVLSSHEGHKYPMKHVFDDPLRKYYFILHIRLEDFVRYGMYIPVQYILSALDNVPLTEFGDNAIVVNAATTELERQYINLLVNWFITHDMTVTVESNDPFEDFNIIRNGCVILCSASTLSWCAVMLSDTVKKCYLPDYTESSVQTLKHPIPDTVLYKIR